MHYTPAQTRWFLLAIERAEREQRIAATLDARIAQADKAEVVRGHINDLAPKD